MEKTNIISKIKEKFREKKTFYSVIITLIVTAIITATGTYAWFSSEASSNATLVTTGTLSVTFDQGRIISANNIKPATREQVLESYNAGNCKYNNEGYNEQICYANTFTITNTGDITAVVSASLTEVTNTFTSYLKYEVFESTPSSLTGQSIGTNTNLVGLPTNVSIPAVTNNTKTYTILIWLDSSATLETDANKSYTSTISVRAVQTNYDGEVEEIPLDESCVDKIEHGELVTYCVTSRQTLQEDPSGANRPILADGMIPIVYDDVEQRWEKVNAIGSYVEWYDYPNRKWANAVMVTNATRDTYMDADVGTPVLEADILAYWVWIPRYKYQLFNVEFLSTESQTINITFESDDTVKSTGTTNESWLTHPAFTFGDQELPGFWIGKFELSSGNACTAEGNSAVGSGCNNTTTNPRIKPGVTSWRGAMVSTYYLSTLNMKTINYLTSEGVNEADIRVLKNTEWGAVAYLSHSIYGKNSEIALNNNSSIYTGGGATNAYVTNVAQSTTRNITGVYDISGGNHEYVMGVMEDGVGTGTPMSGFSNKDNDRIHSGFSGKLYTGGTILGVSFPPPKYYDLYAYGTTYNDQAAYNRSKLGDATGETRGYSYDTYKDIVSYTSPWFMRGGEGNMGSIFSFSDISGYAYTSYTSRFSLSVN